MSVLNRRQFLVASVAGALATSRLRAQTAPGDTAHGPTMSGPMDGSAYRPVTRPPKANGAAPLTQEQRDELERKLKCQCGCVLDVYTCRTTDFTCPLSPAMHRDVLALSSTGYDAQEILIAFQAMYGERVLMAPVKQGFNLVGWGLPFVVIAGGAVAVFRWVRKRSARIAVGAPSAQVAATPAEISAIEAAVRKDD